MILASFNGSVCYELTLTLWTTLLTTWLDHHDSMCSITSRSRRLFSSFSSSSDFSASSLADLYLTTWLSRRVTCRHSNTRLIHICHVWTVIMSQLTITLYGQFHKWVLISQQYQCNGSYWWTVDSSDSDINVSSDTITLNVLLKALMIKSGRLAVRRSWLGDGC